MRSFLRDAPLTAFLLALVGLVYYLLDASGGSENPATLARFGAMNRTLAGEGGAWRYLAACFVHIGILHVVLNSLVLFQVGRFAEGIYGSGRFLAVYLAAGAAGNVASQFSHGAGTLSGGASGALFGLAGLILAAALRFRRTSPIDLGAAARSLVPLVVISLALGWSLPFVDNAAHLGGLAAGSLLGLLSPPLAPGARRWSAGQIGLVALGIAALAASAIFGYREATVTEEPAAGPETAEPAAGPDTDESPDDVADAADSMIVDLFNDYVNRDRVPAARDLDKLRRMKDRVAAASGRNPGEETGRDLQEFGKILALLEQAFDALAAGEKEDFEKIRKEILARHRALAELRRRR
ncbi:MAG: rhomboid family intramembrane serine protease [Planctomycetes bacterium]|nr:rhomboid family intramembrane serine protease [Planctomycetota bacterium]